ncbi:MULTISPECIES: ATP-binding cassette domain-containing protein [unclassified Helicobacter]|uniref:ATP-binding cassette domain-containing protein n=1 Tax=unclassified Helicobacter TaxID=2593540 RepID=UPI000CF09B66|nr:MULTISPECIES: ATP-binding cassette domain-containing protein [unclassified Helicobacter]
MIEICIQKKLSGAQGNFTLDIHTLFHAQKTYGIFGKSGSGKTTFLKILAGITHPDSGIIKYNHQEFFNKEKKFSLPTWKRKVGFVFQNYTLFPHLSVYKNIIFGLDKTMQNQVEELIASLNLEKLCNQKPKNLSGGQSQKVALARAILSNPDILLLDEPFSGLDKDTKSLLQSDLKNILKKYKFTTFLISHDITEMFLLADEVFTLKDGKFIKSGSPSEVFLQKDENKILGKVLSLEEKDSTIQATLLVQNILLSCSLPKTNEKVRVGDIIAMDNNFSLLNFKKI